MCDSPNTQVRQVQPAFLSQPLNLAQSHITRTLEVLCRKAALRSVSPDLLDALRDGPDRLEGRHLATNLGEIDLVVARVRPCACGEGDGSASDLADLLCDRADLDHIFVTADIEGLIVDDITGCFEQRDKRPRDIFN